MPRVVKSKPLVNGVAPAKKAGGKKSKLYAMPEKLKEGTILTDLTKTNWRVGPSIGIGGFGEIYAACRVGEKNYDAVVKCEPHENGPLFVEMHFYLRNAKQDNIKQFKQQHGLKNLGMPYILASGSADVNGTKHRFIVMPRYGSDISKFLAENGKRLPEGTVYRLAIQMLDVYQFLHSTGYIHADLKAANILIGLGKGGAAQAYLVDFGLASHFVTGDYKPDPKKMHNGTIEYTSRDAHMGVATRRADLEILGYNLIEWLGAQLPWVKDKLLAVPLKVQKSKEAFMADVSTALKPLFSNGVPLPISEFMKYVAKLAHNEAPDYDKCRNMFLTALKQIKVANSGDLDFKLKSQSNNNNSNSPPKTSKAAPINKAKNKKDASLVINSSDDVICPSDDDVDDNSIFESRRAPLKKSPMVRHKNTITTPIRKVSPKAERLRPPSASPRKRAATTGIDDDATPAKRSSPRKRSPLQKPNGTPKATESAVSSRTRTPGTGGGAGAKINFSPAISLRGRPGKTVVNDDLTPNPRSNKTYEFNFELDVSMDANVIVNVKRKKKAAAGESVQSSSSSVGASGNGRTPTRSATSNADTPVTRVKLRKVDNNGDGDAGSGRSPRSPAVTMRKFRR